MVDAMSSTLSFSGPRIAALAAKAERGQWLAVETQDWDERISLPWWLPRKFQAAVVSQFYHGEVATIRMCRKLLGAISDPTARRCVEWQIADEKRHAEVYLDYLRAVGPLQPMHPVLKAAAETALSWGENDPGLMTAAFTIILEAEAVFALNYLGRWLRCPKFRRINSRICKDEARHLAFGRIYLKQQFDGLDQQKRMQTYRRLRALWRDTAFGMADHFRFPNFVLRRRCRSWVETGWQDHRKILISIGLVDHDEARLMDGAAP